MTTTDWIIDITLVLIVLRQLREGRIDALFIVIPAAIVVFTAHKYLHGLPTAGNDLLIVALCTALGIALGVAGGFATRVRVADGKAYAKAGAVAATLWVSSMGARLVFVIWATSHSGSAALGRFSATHHITGASVWQTALVLLALSEVVVRLGIIVARGVVQVTR